MVSWRSNFRAMSVAFALCQATVTTPVGFATTLLDKNVGAIGTGILFFFAMVSSLLLGAPVVQTFGPKKGLLTAMTMATIYATLFACAIGVEKGNWVQSALYITGSVLQGNASGILWAAQFAFFTRSAELCARDENAPMQQMTGSLGGVFATTLLMFEILVKLSASFLQGSVLVWKLFDPLMSIQAMFFVFAVAAFSMVFVMLFLVVEPTLPERAGQQDAAARPKFTEKVGAAVKLWPSPLIWCLSGSNVTFGFSAGYMNGYVNAAFTGNKDNKVLGKDSLGTLLALTSLVAAVFAKCFGGLNRKGPAVLFGACCFACIPLSVLLFKPSQANDFWSYGLVALYVLQGIGRAVYEGTNKAVFGDFFPSTEPGVGPNIMMQNSFSFFVSFILQSILTDKSVLAWIVLGLAAFTFPGFLAAVRIHGQAADPRTVALSTEEHTRLANAAAPPADGARDREKQ